MRTSKTKQIKTKHQRHHHLVVMLGAQLVWWGHPDTTSSPAVDFFLSLDDEVDGAWHHYHEQLVRADLINTAVFHHQPAPTMDDADAAARMVRAATAGSAEEDAPTASAEEDAPTASAASLSADGLATFGLALPCGPTRGSGPAAGAEGQQGDGAAHVYLVLGRLFKLHPAFDDALLGILARDDRAVVALIQERQEPWTQAVWARLQAAAADHPDNLT
jgi:hypothetical protein